MKTMTHGTDPTTPNILVVDDMPANLQLLTELLKQSGYRVQPVSSGEQAIQAVHTEPPDLILLDINMPGMNGYEVCKQLKSDATLNAIPVLFISALGETMDKIKAFAVGGVDYIMKPFHFAEVRARVQTHLTLYRLQREREQQNRLLQDNYDQLKALETLRDNLTHLIVHDMRSPLMAITLSLELYTLQSTGKLTAAAIRPIEMATQAANQLIAMVNSLLDVCRMESGNMPLHSEACDLTGLTRDVIQSLQNLKPDCRLELTQPDPAMIPCDRELIRRVITNIGSNAMKFVPADGFIQFNIRNTDAGVKVQITDNGPGIPPEYHTRIFEKFGQVEAHRQLKVYSTGLGLTFCKLAVEAHGGTIGLESEVGKGSTFWFTLPRTMPVPSHW